MDKVTINLAEKEHDGMESEFVELGEVSEDTKGGVWGNNDGGGAFCFC